MPNKSLKMCNTCGGVGKVLNDGVWIKCAEDGIVNLKKITNIGNDCSETKISKEDNEL